MTTYGAGNQTLTARHGWDGADGVDSKRCDAGDEGGDDDDDARDYHRGTLMSTSQRAFPTERKRAYRA